MASLSYYPFFSFSHQAVGSLITIKGCARHVFREFIMANIVISIDQILSFTGNKAIPSIEALVDEAFIAGDTINIESQGRKYSKAERTELIDEIQ